MAATQRIQALGLATVVIITAACLAHIDNAFGADDSDTQVSRGAVAWAQACQRCHNMRDPTEFRDDQWRVIVSHMRVRGGLDGQQARDILAFLQASNGGYWNGEPRAAADSPAIASPAGSERVTPATGTGQAVYERTCIACHGPDGRGTLPGVPDFTTRGGPLAKSDDVLRRSILKGVPNPASPTVMPPKGGDPALTEADAAAVLKYMQTAFGGAR